MASKKSNPVAGGGGARECLQLAGVDVPENKPSQIELQGFRAAFLARRFALAPAMARVVAELNFGEART
jgi:hypothetical protein